MEPISVTQLNEYVRGLLAKDIQLRAVQVQGEVSGFKRYPSGHLYFSLKDKDSLVRCVMFRSSAQSLRFAPQDGMQVVVLAEASLYSANGQFQLYVQAMRQQGEGDLHRQFLLLKDKLQAAGYFQEARKRALPFLPSVVGIITSGSGAALQDLLQIIRRRFPAMHIDICPVQVQGYGAAETIAKAITYMNRASKASLLIVGRGGGSMEDLSAFNEEVVATAIFHSRIPVISAVGHETDYTIADFVADLRAPTPSAAAELAVPEYLPLMQKIDSYLRRLPVASQRIIDHRCTMLRIQLQRRGFLATKEKIAASRASVSSTLERLTYACHRMLETQRTKLSAFLMKAEGLSPTSMLTRGFSYVHDSSGHVVSSAAQLKAGMPVRLILLDGEADATVQAVRLQKEDLQN